MDADGWRAAAGDLLLGASCHGCGAPGWGLCAGCRVALDGRAPHLVPPPVGAGPVLVTVASSPYDPLVSHLVTAHKERGALGLAPVLAGRLALSVHALLRATAWSGPVVVVPVPSAGPAVRRRGYDATATLARLAARRLRDRHPGLTSRRWLAQRRGVRDQAGLTARERSANLAGAVRLRRLVLPPPTADGAVVVLVDDVVTTGASLAESARALEEAGAVVLGAATVAATARHPSTV